MAGFNTPFRRLGKAIKATLPARQMRRSLLSQPSFSKKESVSETDNDLFTREMHGVTRLKQEQRVSKGPPILTRRSLEEANNEAIAELSDLVAGRAVFDVTLTDEYIEGCVVGLDPRLLRKLRMGEFARQGALDLHGMKADEAKEEVEHFLNHAARNGVRCVLIVHGRGLNSPGQFPILKDRLKQWLTRGRLSKIILAFCSARAHDGGPGAIYALLRRNRAQKKEIMVLEGTPNE